jgi:hypothetical protein
MSYIAKIIKRLKEKQNIDLFNHLIGLKIVRSKLLYRVFFCLFVLNIIQVLRISKEVF